MSSLLKLFKQFVKSNGDKLNHNSRDGLTGNNGDVLSNTAPNSLQHQNSHDTSLNRITPISSSRLVTSNGNCNDSSDRTSFLASMEDQMSGSSGTVGINGISGMGSTLDINQQFNRSAQARMSLPIMQQNKLRRQAYSQLQRRGQHQVARSLGHIYLQHKGETKQASLPNELTTIYTIRALFVCAFPHLLTMEYMSQPHVKIYIYNPSCNIFYELCDIEDVRHESVLRIHHSEPVNSIAISPIATSNGQVNSIDPIGPVSHQLHMSYSTLGRLPPRIPPQRLEMSQQAHPQSRQQHQSLHALCQSGVRSASMLPNHLVQHPMVAQHNQRVATQHHLPNLTIPHLSQIPPPKPRRMIPANYSIHHTQAHQ